jgi:BlaI family transcriptional regulator, penicillinase repressor
MKSIPKISEAEWEVMKVIWDSPKPLTSQEVIDSVAERQNWSPKTVRTLVNRLSKKGALGFERRGRAYLYTALVSQEACVGELSETFLERAFGGALKPMLAHFVQQKRLSKKEVNELKRLLDGKK